MNLTASTAVWDIIPQQPVSKLDTWVGRQWPGTPGLAGRSSIPVKMKKRARQTSQHKNTPAPSETCTTTRTPDLPGTPARSPAAIDACLTPRLRTHGSHSRALDPYRNTFPRFRRGGFFARFPLGRLRRMTNASGERIARRYHLQRCPCESTLPPYQAFRRRRYDLPLEPPRRR
jgi:hypothetical protein